MTEKLVAACTAADASLAAAIGVFAAELRAPVRAVPATDEVRRILPAPPSEEAERIRAGRAWGEAAATGRAASGDGSTLVPIRAGGELLAMLEIQGGQADAEVESGAAVLGLFLGRELERMRAERMIAMFDHIAHPIFVKDRAYRWVLLNRAFCELVGWSREELLYRSDYDFFPKEQADWFRARDREMFETHRTVQVDEEPITDASGTTHLLATTKVPLVAPDGSTSHLVGIIHDITHLKAVEAELQRKNEELALEVAEKTAAMARLDAINEELESFSYSVSHDLRAPLRSIDGFSKAVLEDWGERLDEQGRRYLERIRANANRMRQLIDDMLSLSRVSRTELRPLPVDLSAMAEEIVEGLREGDPGRQVEVEIEPALEVRGDKRLLGIALENLLRNAWKFTCRAEGARIEVGSVERDGERLWFVRDNGAGFDMADAGKLFRPFSRLHRAEDFPGTGIGLATVQRIVHRHGGRIWAEAKPGQGATFWFTVPEQPLPA